MLTDGRTDGRTNGRKLARLCLPAKAGATKMLRIQVYSFPKMEKLDFTMMCLKDADPMTNSVDPDQTAPLKAV